MDDQQLARYARHILLDELGIEGQQALLSSHIIVIGAGGLGCACLPYLAAAGIGKISIIDNDEIALSNLQRQILFNENNLSQAKASIAQQRLQQLNPNITIHAIAQAADSALLDTLLPHTDAVVDCTDNFITRHIINQACVRHRIPLISGAAMRFTGQATVFNTRLNHSPCYACIFPADQAVTEENCAVMGVFSPTVAFIGAIQASETLKLLSGIGTSLIGKLLTFNNLSLNWHTIPLERDPDCRVCQQ